MMPYHGSRLEILAYNTSHPIPLHPNSSIPSLLLSLPRPSLNSSSKTTSLFFPPFYTTSYLDRSTQAQTQTVRSKSYLQVSFPNPRGKHKTPTEKHRQRRFVWKPHSLGGFMLVIVMNNEKRKETEGKDR
jgi:hypothetical protein